MKLKPSFSLVIYVLTGFIWMAGATWFENITDPRSTGPSVSFFLLVFLFLSLSAFFFFRLLNKLQVKLDNADRQYENFFEHNPNPMWIYDVSNYHFVAVNSAAIEKYGYSRDEFLNMTVLDIRLPEDRQHLKDFIKRNKAGRRHSGTWRHQKKAGETFYVSIQSHTIVYNKRQCVLVLALDITKQVLQESQLQNLYNNELELNNALAGHLEQIKRSSEDNRRFSNILAQISNVVMILDKNGNIVWTNHAFSKTTGFTAEEAAGQSAIDLLAGEKTEVSLIWNAVDVAKNGYVTSSLEIVNYTKDRKEYWVEITFTPIFDESGNFEGLISVENVITERKEREQKIKNQNQVLRQIAWVSSHEVRKPVSSILSLVTLLKSLKEDHEKDECLNLLEVCSLELDDIVRRISKKVNMAEI